jgi:hypothetical protein
MNNKEYYKKLIKDIRTMKRYHKFYRVLKTELLLRDYWKNHSRGKNINQIKEESENRITL